MTKSTAFIFMVFTAFSMTWSHNAKPMVEHNCANTLLRSSESIGKNPQRSVDCFAIYMPLLNEATDRYEKQYATCMEISAKASAAIDTEVALDRANVIEEGQAICTLYTKCSKRETSYGLFECYNDASSSVTSTSYEIQTVCKGRMQYIEVKMNMVTYEETACTNRCSDDYLQESSRLYAQLEACLAGFGP